MTQPPSTSTNDPDDFYRAFGIAMLTWQKVEAALFRLLYSLYEGGNMEQVGAAYYCLDSFGAKLRLVDSTAGEVLEEDRLQAWASLRQGIRELTKDRNVLAHLAAFIEGGTDDGLNLVLAPHPYVPKSLRRPRKKLYDTAECERLANQFDELAARIDSFIGA